MNIRTTALSILSAATLGVSANVSTSVATVGALTAAAVYSSAAHAKEGKRVCWTTINFSKAMVYYETKKGGSCRFGFKRITCESMGRKLGASVMKKFVAPKGKFTDYDVCDDMVVHTTSYYIKGFPPAEKRGVVPKEVFHLRISPTKYFRRSKG